MLWHIRPNQSDLTCYNKTVIAIILSTTIVPAQFTSLGNDGKIMKYSENDFTLTKIWSSCDRNFGKSNFSCLIWRISGAESFTLKFIYHIVLKCLILFWQKLNWNASPPGSSMVEIGCMWSTDIMTIDAWWVSLTSFSVVSLGIVPPFNIV